MPNANTFQIAPIRELIEKYIRELNPTIIVDPFANTSRYANISNDLDPDMPTMYHMDATDFLMQLDDACTDLVLYDPPYSPRQVSESYKKLGMSVDTQTTQASYWSRQKAEISRIIKPDGYVISFGWNSGGIGMKYGFEIVEILLVPHGGQHNDTICTVEKKPMLQF